MTKNVYRIAGLAVVAGAAIVMTACVGISPESKKAESPEIAAGKTKTQGSLTNESLTLAGRPPDKMPGGAAGKGGDIPCSMVQACVRGILILGQPRNQVLFSNAEASFSVDALVGPPFTKSGLTYQWQVNKYLLDPMDPNTNWMSYTGVDATNSSIEITNVQLSDVGYYRVLVSAWGSTTVTSAAPYLQVIVPGSIIVNGTPIAGTDGGSGYCPAGTYKGYIPFTNNPPTAWGWAVINTNLAISGSDNVTATSRVMYTGYYGDADCAIQTVSKPPPITTANGSPRYEFTLYFVGSIPTTPRPYPLTLTNLW